LLLRLARNGRVHQVTIQEAKKHSVPLKTAPKRLLHPLGASAYRDLTDKLRFEAQPSEILTLVDDEGVEKAEVLVDGDCCGVGEYQHG
jgi:hypothetical protein